MFKKMNSDLPNETKSFRILVVDDEAFVRDLFDQALKTMGHEVLCVEDGCSAIERIKKDTFDVIFLDIVMPGMDGIEALKKIKEIDPDLPIIMMTGFAVEAKMNEALTLGALDYIYKPFDVDKGREVIGKEFKKVYLRLIRTGNSETDGVR